MTFAQASSLAPADNRGYDIAAALGATANSAFAPFIDMYLFPRLKRGVWKDIGCKAATDTAARKISTIRKSSTGPSSRRPSSK